MKKLFLSFLIIHFIFVVKAQTGDISGKVKDERGEGITHAKVVLVDSSGTPTGKGQQCDFDGNYVIMPLIAGKYNLQISCKGYFPQTTKGIIVASEKSTFVDVRLKSGPPEPKKKRK